MHCRLQLTNQQRINGQYHNEIQENNDLHTELQRCVWRICKLQATISLKECNNSYHLLQIVLLLMKKTLFEAELTMSKLLERKVFNENASIPQHQLKLLIPSLLHQRRCACYLILRFQNSKPCEIRYFQHSFSLFSRYCIPEFGAHVARLLIRNKSHLYSFQSSLQFSRITSHNSTYIISQK